MADAFSLSGVRLRRDSAVMILIDMAFSLGRQTGAPYKYRDLGRGRRQTDDFCPELGSSAPRRPRDNSGR